VLGGGPGAGQRIAADCHRKDENRSRGRWQPCSHHCRRLLCANDLRDVLKAANAWQP
jgi:hypothetical protein